MLMMVAMFLPAVAVAVAVAADDGPHVDVIVGTDFPFSVGEGFRRSCRIPRALRQRCPCDCIVGESQLA
ncbi:MAG: hypothetical protein AAFV53_20505 [Myxococcota bacterium]